MCCHTRTDLTSLFPHKNQRIEESIEKSKRNFGGLVVAPQEPIVEQSIEDIPHEAKIVDQKNCSKISCCRSSLSSKLHEISLIIRWKYY
jgi:hypothetical protein